jgi:hypothetical protein
MDGVVDSDNLALSKEYMEQVTANGHLGGDFVRVWNARNCRVLADAMLVHGKQWLDIAEDQKFAFKEGDSNPQRFDMPMTVLRIRDHIYRMREKAADPRHAKQQSVAVPDNLALSKEYTEQVATCGNLNKFDSRQTQLWNARNCRVLADAMLVHGRRRANIAKDHKFAFKKDSPSLKRFDRPVTGSQISNHLRFVRERSRKLQRVKQRSEVQNDDAVLPSMKDDVEQWEAFMLLNGRKAFYATLAKLGSQLPANSSIADEVELVCAMANSRDFWVYYIGSVMELAARINLPDSQVIINHDTISKLCGIITALFQDRALEIMRNTDNWLLKSAATQIAHITGRLKLDIPTTEKLAAIKNFRFVECEFIIGLREHLEKHFKDN